MSPLNDRRLRIFKYPLILFRVFHPLLEFEGFGIGLEVDSTAGIFRPLQYSGDRFGAPLVQVIRHGASFLPGVIRSDRQYPVGSQDFCDLQGAFSRNAQVEDTPHHLCGFLVYNPFLFILWIFHISIGRIAGDVFPGFPAHFDNCPDFFACVLGVIVVKYVFEHSEVIFALCTVHIIIDGDKPDIVGREDEILQPPHIRILPAQT